MQFLKKFKSYIDHSLVGRNSYKNNQKEGYWKEYFENGKLKSEGYYKNGIKNGYWKNYNQKDKLETEGNYINGLKEGMWKKYWENSVNLKSKCNYTNNLKNGTLIEYIKNNNTKNNDIYRKIEYKNGIRDGYYQEFKSNKSSIFLFKHGILKNNSMCGYWEILDNGVVSNVHIPNRLDNLESIFSNNEKWIKLSESEFNRVNRLVKIEKRLFKNKYYYVFDISNVIVKLEDDYYYVYNNDTFSKCDQLGEALKKMK